jgi:hypothetical protein
MKEENKEALEGCGLVLVIIVLVACIFAGPIHFAIEDKKELKAIQKRIGNQIVINKDTLIITDYSRKNKNYTLSNGTKLSFEHFK